MKTKKNDQVLQTLINNINLTAKARKEIEKILEEADSYKPRELYICIDEKPKVKKRPRTSFSYRMYNPSSGDEKLLRQTIQRVLDSDFTVIETPVELEVTFFLKTPESFSASKKVLAEMGVLLPQGRPDVDNLLKLTQDALNGLVYKDDSLVVKVSSAKFYSSQPRTEIFISY